MHLVWTFKPRFEGCLYSYILLNKVKIKGENKDVFHITLSPTGQLLSVYLIIYKSAGQFYWELRVLLCGFWLVVCTTYFVYPVSSNFVSVFQKSNVTHQGRHFVKRHNITERYGALHNEMFHSCNSLPDNSKMLNERWWDRMNM